LTGLRVSLSLLEIPAAFVVGLNFRLGPFPSAFRQIVDLLPLTGATTLWSQKDESPDSYFLINGFSRYPPLSE